MKLKQFAAASLCVAAGAFAAPAMAAVVEYDITSLNTTQTNILTNLLIQKFDSSLGTLTGITIEYESAVSGHVALSNSSLTKDKSATVGLTATMALTGPGGLSLSDTDTLFSGVVVTAVKNTTNVIVASGEGNLSGSQALDAAYFGLFTGTGSVTASLAINATGAAAVSSGVRPQFTTLADGAGKVTYTYDIAPVPEPETYGMLLLGLGVVAYAAKRKSRSAQA
ncbi:choice-of-anchor E domain-containing protein [Duganella radicis]|uniref:Choice-of-anchor E domain-containing protein n=1 Tax=Duganella radicis TaxID=551988 RepID=A0A6L6PKF3_9BURK|nr:choice-of-anchor E domain-containing protein [Duganella radicis]MTV39550.1 choice-of-anchor E domain-containing protein [Duganella radicis]